MTALRGKRVFHPGDRLCDIVSQLCLYLDMQIIAFNTVAERPMPPVPTKGRYASLPSGLFDVSVYMPIYFPFAASFKPGLGADADITIVEGGMPPGLDEYKSPGLAGMSLMIWNMSLVFFYEQQLDGLMEKFGTKRDDWPEVARFAWALRNAAAHNGALHFSKSDVRPVEWHHLRYDAGDNGKKVIGDVMKPADVLIFLVEFSDELDRLGV
jgi:hypothetical protein